MRSRAGVLDLTQLPLEPIAVLGDTGPRRIDALVHDLVEESGRAGDIVQGEQIGGAMAQLRQWMFDHVYLGPVATRERRRIMFVISTLFDHYCAHPDEIPASIPPAPPAARVTDWIAGMTDRFCIRTFQELSVPVAFVAP